MAESEWTHSQMGVGPNVKIIKPGEALREVSLTIDDLPGLVIIGIGGPTTAGKSTLARSLAEQLDAELVPCDNFFGLKRMPYVSYPCGDSSKETRNIYNWETIYSVDWDLLAEHLKSLADGEEKIVIVEGFLIFSQAWLRNLMKIGIHIHIPKKVAEERIYRVKRVPMGYLDSLIWPAYLQWGGAPDGSKFFQANGTQSKEIVLQQAIDFLTIKDIYEIKLDNVKTISGRRRIGLSSRDGTLGGLKQSYLRKMGADLVSQLVLLFLPSYKGRTIANDTVVHKYKQQEVRATLSFARPVLLFGRSQFDVVYEQYSQRRGEPILSKFLQDVCKTPVPESIGWLCYREIAIGSEASKILEEYRRTFRDFPHDIDKSS